MTLRQALNAAIAHLEAEHIGSPRMNAELLLMFTLGCDRAHLYAYPERELTADEQERYDEAIAERARGVPAQYITGHQEFWGLDFIVTPAVLIPRPETEHVVEAALDIARGLLWPKIVDVGTGSGCIALALANELPQAEIYATDISEDAIEVARVNAARLQLDRVHFSRADVLENFADEEFDMVVSNPPYVGEWEADKVQAQVKKFEPHIAVFGGPQGTELVQRLAEQAHRVLKPGGWLLVEIGYTQAEQVRRQVSGWAEVSFVQDLQGIDRVLVAQKAKSK